MKKDFFEAMLHGVGQIHIPLRNLLLRITWRSEHLYHAARKMPRQRNRTIGLYLHAFVASDWLEKVEVKFEARSASHQQLAKLLAVGIFAVGDKTHELAFIAIFVVSDELANHGVETPKRMWEEDAIQHLNFISFAARHHG